MRRQRALYHGFTKPFSLLANQHSFAPRTPLTRCSDNARQGRWIDQREGYGEGREAYSEAHRLSSLKLLCLLLLLLGVLLSVLHSGFGDLLGALEL